MNSQNNEPDSKATAVGKNAPSPDLDEGISSNGERAKLHYADKRIDDDLNDYIYLKPVKRKSGKKSSHSHGKHKKKKMKTYKKVIISVISTILALVVLFAGTLAYLIYRGSQQMLENTSIITAPQGVSVQDDGQYVVYNGQTYELNKNITSILCMGVDREQLSQDETAGGTGGQADVIILMVMDTSNGKTVLLNISRDTMTDVAVYSAGGSYIETRTEQICLSYAYGDGKETSCENTVTAVKRLLYNIPINSYLALDLEGIAAINDSVGGIDVVSPETIGSFVQGESYHLEGDMAESFVRSRNTSQLESNAGRMQRQQAYLNSFIETLIAQTKQDIMTPVNLFNTASSYSCTNLNPSKVCYLAQNILLNSGMSIEMKSVPGEIKAGEKYAEFYMNEDEFYPIFLDIFYNSVS